jgi:thiol-disulfide isomerase/thioredoxin
MGSRFVEVKVRALVCVVAVGLGLAAGAHAGTDWNDGQIAWKGYEAGLAEAKAQDKPICLVFYTEWCPHCTRYSQVFKDPALVELTKKFVMIRVERDANPQISEKYVPDGNYIPRTFFLTPAGVLRPEIHEKRTNYLYFFSESDPNALMTAMRQALGDG